MRRSNYRNLAALGLGIILLTGPCPIRTAKAQGKPDIDPNARELLTQVAATYVRLNAYSDHGRLTATMVSNGQPREFESAIALAFERPNRLALSFEGVHFFCDGTSLVFARDALKKYQKRPGPARISLADVQVSPLGSMLMGAPNPPPVTVLLTLLLAQDPVSALLEGVQSLHLETNPDKPSEQVLILRRTPKPELRIHFNSKSLLISRILSSFDAAQLQANASPGSPLESVQLVWVSGELSTESLPIQSFAFTPGAGMSEVVVAKPKAPAAAEKHKLVGQPAPDFKFQVLEPANKTRTFSKADAAGKVVVLDFWATWCPPCREELPEIKALADRLAQRSGGKALVIALSQDREPDDGSSLRTMVEKSLEELKVSALLTGPAAKVGLDANQETGEAFGVTGIPMLVVIDAQGTIRAVHVGYHEGVGEVLADQVESLLTGKPIKGSEPPRNAAVPAE